MGFLDGILNTALDIVSTPVDIIRDVAEGNENKRTHKKMGKTLDDASSIFDFMD